MVHSVQNIVNLHTVEDIDSWLENPTNTYIGRGTEKLSASKWGNPYKVNKKNTREKVTGLYEKHIKGNKKLANSIGELKGKNLGCWCSPKLCHGEILHRLAGNIPVYENTTTMATAAEENEIQTETSQTTTQRMIVITNIDPAVTEEQLCSTLALDATPFMKDNSAIQIYDNDDGGRSAKISVPDNVAEHLLNLQGKTVQGRKWQVQEIFETDEERNIEVLETTDPPEPERDINDIRYMIIDCRFPCWVWNQVKLIEVIDALQIDHEEDYSKSVGRLKTGIWSLDSDNFSRYVGKTITIRGVDINLKPKYKQLQRMDDGSNGRTYSFGKPRRREGTLITIFGAYQRRNRHIPNELFDENFQNMNGVEVIKQTEPQKTKGTTVLNNNRYLVVKSVDPQVKKLDVGTSMTIMGNRFNIAYDGMERFCFLCNAKHGAGCPVKMRFDMLKLMRAGKTDKRKIYSTSVLAHTNQLALTTDVACMSGGGIGQLCNVIPSDTKHEEVIILAGTNEITRTENLHEFVYTIEKTVEKLRALAEDNQVTMVIPVTPCVNATEMGKAKFLEQQLTEVKEIKTVKLNTDTIEFDGVHPTRVGTEDIIRQLNDLYDKEIVLPDATSEDLTTPSRYSKVQGIFKVGCRACQTTDICAFLCDTCKASSESTNTDSLAKLIEEIELTHFPPIDPNDNNVLMDDENEIQRKRRRVEDIVSHLNEKVASTGSST